MRRIAAATAATLGLVVLIPAIAPAAETTSHPPGQGTGSSMIKAVEVVVGDSLRVGAVHSASDATLDHRRASVPENRVFREFSGALVEAAGQSHTLPDPPWTVQSTASNPGPAEQETAALSVRLPGQLSGPARSALADVPLADVLPDNGDDNWLLDATLTPSRIYGSFTGLSGGSIHAALNVGSVEVLDGLVDLQDVGPGEIDSATSPSTNSSGTRGLEIGDVSLLDLDALLEALNLGGLSVLGETPLAALADSMRLSLTLDAVDVSPYGSWEAALAAVDAIEAALDQAVAAGLTCLGLDASLRQRIDTLYEAVDRPPLDCTTAIASRIVDDVLDAADDLTAAMRGGLEGEALLSLRDLGGNTEARAEVLGNGDPAGMALAWAQVGSVRVGGEDLGGFASDLADATLDQLEGKIDAALSEITSALGPEYANLVTVDVLPVHAQQPTVQGDYVVSQARVAALALYVTPPGTTPLPASAVVGDLSEGIVTRSAGSTLDLSNTIRTAALSPAPMGTAGAVRGQVGSVEPIAIVVGKLVSDAEHTRPGVTFPCEGVCTLPNTCDADLCAKGGAGSSSSVGVPGSDGSRGDLPRTGSDGLLALTALGGGLLTTAHWLRRRAVLLGVRPIPGPAPPPARRR